MHHSESKVELTIRFGRRPEKIAITHTLSLSSATVKYFASASILSFVFVELLTLNTNAANIARPPLCNAILSSSIISFSLITVRRFHFLLPLVHLHLLYHILFLLLLQWQCPLHLNNG